MQAIERRKRFIARNHNVIVSLYPNTRKVYGPYLAKDSRYRVVLYDGKRRITRQYAKLKMEVKLERRIFEPETVDHDDQNTRNDKYSNLVLRDRVTHAKLDAKRVKKSVLKCIWCKSKFKGKPRKRGAAGPFCSRTCTGQYGSHISLGGKKLPPHVKMITEYYTWKDLWH